MWRESSPQQYITTHHDCELHGSDCARPWLQIAVELLRQGVHDRVLCSYHLACCQLRLMRWCPMWWWNPPENSRKYPEIFKKKCNHLHISSHEHPFFNPLFRRVHRFATCRQRRSGCWIWSLVLANRLRCWIKKGDILGTFMRISAFSGWNVMVLSCLDQLL